MGGEKTLKLLSFFKSQVNEKFPIEKMILFGSRATGKFHKDSDIDLIIVSKKFKGLNFFKRGYNMYRFWNYDYPVDFICYTPEEFERLSNKITIVKQALEEGIEI